MLTSAFKHVLLRQPYTSNLQYALFGILTWHKIVLGNCFGSKEQLCLRAIKDYDLHKCSEQNLSWPFGQSGRGMGRRKKNLVGSTEKHICVV